MPRPGALSIAFLLLSIAILLLSCLPLSAAHADTATVPCDRDNTLYESATGALSNGAGPTMFAGRTNQPSNSRRRALVHFDVAGAIPAGSTITAVALTMNASQVATALPQGVAVHRVLADWGEGTSNAGDPGGTGAPATAGDATWKHRFFSATLWAALGGDFVAGSSAVLAVGDVGPWTWASTPALVADAQGWLDAPATNFGWLLTGDEGTGATTKRFDTRESSDGAARPGLTITYTPPATPATNATWGRLKASYR
jgi:hypothetical protein